MKTSLGSRGRRLVGPTPWVIVVLLAGASVGRAQSGKGEANIPESLRDQMVEFAKNTAKAVSEAKAQPPRSSFRAPKGPASPTDAFATLLMNADNLACSFWKQWVRSALHETAQKIAADGSPQNLERYQKLWDFRSRVLRACDGAKKDDSQADPGGAVTAAEAKAPPKKPCCDPEFSQWWWAGWSLRNAERELKEAERRASVAEEFVKKHGSDARRDELTKEIADYQAKASARSTSPDMKKFYDEQRKGKEIARDLIDSMRKDAKEYKARAEWLKQQLPSLRAAEKAAKVRYQECVKKCVEKDRKVGMGLGTGQPVATVVTRPNAGGGSSFLVSVSGSLSGMVVDEVRTKIDSKVAGEKPEETALPAGWSMKRHGKEWVFTGPPVEDGVVALAVHFKKPVAFPEQVGLQVFSDDALLVDQTVSVVTAPAVQTLTSLQDILRLPQVVTPLETIELVPSNLALTPPGGLWEIDGVPLAVADWTAGLTGELSPRLSFTVPASWSTAGGPSVRYTDPWGDRLVDAVAEDVTLATPSPQLGASPSITGCTPRAFVGASVCVCGFFPGDSANHVTLNGEPLGTPLSASSLVVNFVLSPDQVPGRFEIGGESSAGFSYTDLASGEVVRVGGSVDRDKLFRGESTPLALWVEGTQDVVELQLTNTTPSIISLEGGESQVVATSGGPDNRVEGMVRGIKPGPFNLRYELSADPCPCAQEVASPPDTTVQ